MLIHMLGNMMSRFWRFLRDKRNQQVLGVARRRASRRGDGTVGRLCVFLPSCEIFRDDIVRAGASQRPGKLWWHCHWPRCDWLDHYGRYSNQFGLRTETEMRRP